MTQNTVWFKIDAIQGRAHNLTFWRVAYWCGKFQPRVDEVLRVTVACAHLYVTEYDGDIIACVLKTWRKSSWTRARYVFLTAHSKLAVSLFEEIQLAGPYKYRPAHRSFYIQKPFLPWFQFFPYSIICPYFYVVMLERTRTQHITSIPDTKGVASINFSWASASVSELFEFPYNNIDQFFSFFRIPSIEAPVFFLLLCPLFICGRDWVERNEKDD